MKRSEVIRRVMRSCDCCDEEAKELLDKEMETLAELCHMGQLREQDFELACATLGIGAECESYFIECL